MRPAHETLGGKLGSLAWRYARHEAPNIHPLRYRQQTTVASVSNDEKDALQRLEAVLFLAKEPLPSRKLAQFARLSDGTRARTLIRQINKIYDEVGRAFRIEEVAGGFQLLTRPNYANWLRRLDHVPREVRISTPAMETLAVIAYRQPIIRADVDAIRGVNCSEIIRQLMERDLVRIGGRSEDLGRPYLYTTTKKFLQLFGLGSLDKLPRTSVMLQDQENNESEMSESLEENRTVQETTSLATLADEDLDEAKPNLQRPEDEPKAFDEDDDFDDSDEDDDDEDDDFEDEDFEDEDYDEFEEEDEEDDDDYEDDDWEEVDDDDDADDSDDDDDGDDDWGDDDWDEEDDDFDDEDSDDADDGEEDDDEDDEDGGGEEW